MSTDAANSRTLAGWNQVFAGFESKLERWLSQTVEPDSEPPAPTAEPLPSRRFEERLKRLQTYLDRAERNAEQALTPLTAEIQALRQWLEAMNMARAKLVERTVPTV
ncbi:MAG TPA: hypothetical protein VH643_13505 [Gemmataceae bacterium]|jgi:hypothetical protein